MNIEDLTPDQLAAIQAEADEFFNWSDVKK